MGSGGGPERGPHPRVVVGCELCVEKREREEGERERERERGAFSRRTALLGREVRGGRMEGDEFEEEDADFTAFVAAYHS